ncbi:hypothetical protein ElyMa_001834100 [Elysia marginata]|uniref:Uncharacterized protein n=1 Tax=Elysia marginata TaxID=1093978 RepID=A0AAV4EIG9_9GAST|nr:hypothetical protein ElyMa_001834100 [Elysia marginata]
MEHTNHPVDALTASIYPENQHLTTINYVESYYSEIKQTPHTETRLDDCIQLMLTCDIDLVRTNDINSHLHMLNVKKTKEAIIDFGITKKPMHQLEINNGSLKPSALSLTSV